MLLRSLYALLSVCNATRCLSTKVQRPREGAWSLVHLIPQLVEVVVGLLQNVNVVAVSHVAAERENAGISRNSPFEHA